MHSIRYADASDAPILGRIHSSSWKIAYEGIVPDEVLQNITAEKREKYFFKALTEGFEEDVILYCEDEAAGLLSIGRCRDADKDESYGEIWGIYLLPEFFSRGLGSVLLDWGITELKKRGYRHITLWVLEDNMRAREFYEHKGFRHDGLIKEITIGRKLNEMRYILE